jgi:WD40 repeat protein
MVHDSTVISVSFSEDGKSAISSDGTGSVRIWLWNPDDLINDVCSRLLFNIPKDVWEHFFGDEPYHVTCPNLPVLTD